MSHTVAERMGVSLTCMFLEREERRLRFFENRVLRRIFVSKRDEVTGEWRRLDNKELYAPYFSPNIILEIKSRRLRWAGLVARMLDIKGAYGVLGGET